MRLLSITAVLASAAVLAACGSDSKSDSDSGSKGAEVNVKTFIFDPDPITVDAGTKVTWTNADATPHDVTSGPRSKPDGEFGGELTKSGGTYATTFDKPGTYKYFCSLHSGAGMEGEVVVK